MRQWRGLAANAQRYRALAVSQCDAQVCDAVPHREMGNRRHPEVHLVSLEEPTAWIITHFNGAELRSSERSRRVLSLNHFFLCCNVTKRQLVVSFTGSSSN